MIKKILIAVLLILLLLFFIENPDTFKKFLNFSEDKIEKSIDTLSNKSITNQTIENKTISNFTV
ncbi:hypothetical protein J4440_06425 [Candidatus Woesearchaeota archaeon]|nr:hypothetical protein [Candidatus Woesearchaeota archaeon]